MWFYLLDMEIKMKVYKISVFHGLSGALDNRIALVTVKILCIFHNLWGHFGFFFACCCHKTLSHFLLTFPIFFSQTCDLAPTLTKNGWSETTNLPVHLFYGSECLFTCFKNKHFAFVSQPSLKMDGPHCWIFIDFECSSGC